MPQSIKVPKDIILPGILTMTIVLPAAFAEGAIASGCLFIAGYPITPATEIAEVISARMPGRKD
jgi:TPP-dependent indolepyruvate ferredoxin oxidoreductase alpha subunit